MHYLKFALITAIIGSLTAGCQKESISPANQSDSQNMTTSGGGMSKAGPSKGAKGGSGKGKQGPGNNQQKDQDRKTARINQAKTRRANYNNFSDGSGIRNNDMNFVIFDREGNLIKAKPNPRYMNGGIYANLMCFVSYTNMTLGKDGWYRPKPNVPWGLNEETDIQNVVYLEEESPSDRSHNSGSKTTDPQDGDNPPSYNTVMNNRGIFGPQDAD